MKLYYTSIVYYNPIPYLTKETETPQTTRLKSTNKLHTIQYVIINWEHENNK